MRRYALACLAAGMLAAGCAPKPYLGDTRDLHEEMGSRDEAVELPDLKPAPQALGPEAPYLPLVQPPQVQRVWVTAHLNDAGDLIAGHWVYLMLESSQWFLRDYQGTQELRLKLPGRAPLAPQPARQ